MRCGRKACCSALEGEVSGGATRELVIHRERLPDLQRALDGELQPQRSTLLSPFDSLLWSKRPRPYAFWGYHHDDRALCAAGQTQVGLLHAAHPAARPPHRPARPPNSNAKAARCTFARCTCSLAWHPDERLVGDVAAALRDFMAFHGARQLKFGRKGNAQFRVKLTTRTRSLSDRCDARIQGGGAIQTSSVRRSAPSLRTPCATPARAHTTGANADAALLRADGEDAAALQHAVDLVLIRVVVQLAAAGRARGN